jgi:RNA polymerase sigma-70 factor (ECF subfamily)
MKSSPATERFGDLALPLLPVLYRHAVWLCRDHAEAEDLVQETLSKALRGFESFQTGTNFKAWIFRVLRNSFLTSRTGLATARTVFLEDHPGLLESTEDGSTPEAHLIRLSDQAAVHQALDQLQPQLREAILLCDLEELKYKEIAEVLDIPIGTVMSRIARGRRALYQLLQPQYRESR